MKPIFRTTMFGFNKEDVFNFITKQNKQYDLKVSELNSELEKQKSEFDLEKEAFERDTDEIERLNLSLRESNALLKTIADLLHEVLDDESRVYNCAVKVKEENDVKIEKLNAMKKRVEEAETLREKAEKFDRLSGVLSSIFNQPEMASATSEIAKSEAIEHDDFSDTNTVSDLLSYIEVLSIRLEKLREVISAEKQDA